MNILWIGPVVSPTEVMNFIAVSPAANIWQLNFLNSFAQDDNIILLTYLPQPYYPNGSLMSSRKNYNKEQFSFRSISNKFLNIPIFRDLTLVLNILYNSRNVKNIDYLITYNSYFPHKLLGCILRKTKSLKWINIAADHDATKFSDATIFLSYYFYKNSNLKNKIFIDGGIEKPINLINEQLTPNLNVNNPHSQKKILLYCGAINKWTGIIEFVQSFLKLSPDITSNWQLIVYGKGEVDYLKSIANNNNSIKIVGFVNEDILNIAMRECYAFINPRPENIPKGENNFPSKLLTYLKYQKPIISTRSPGLSPNYENYLFFYSNTYELKHQLTTLSTLSNNDLITLNKKLKQFCLNNSWNEKVKNLKIELSKLN